MPAAPAPYYRLRIKSLKFISAVDAGAQGPIANVALIKRAPNGDEIQATCRVVKTDEKMGLVFGWALASTLDGGATPHVDLQNDAIVGDDDLIKIAADFVEAGASSDVLHSENHDGKVVFAMPLTREVNAALGIKSDVHGLAIAMRPSPETFKRFLSKELNAFSIGGTGERELVKSAPACPGCGTYGKADDEKCAKCGTAMKRSAVGKGTWSTADVDSLPDSSFLLVESGGKRDADGKTAPRSLRHFPYRDATGKIDLPHLRDAIGRIPQSSLPKDVRDRLQVRAEKLLGKQHAAAKRMAKQAVLTSSADGHQHSIDLDDPADEWRDQCATSYQTSEGATQSHCHAWTYDATTGKITIAEDSGHTHTIAAVVPADVLTQAAANESGERCPGCGSMCEEGCRFCPKCGAAMDRRDGVPSATTDAGSGSGASVVIVAARAPDRNSPPSGAVPTVKSETKEPTAMPDLNDKIRELEASNARLSKMATLTDAQRAHHGKLNGTDAEAFLAKSAHERDLVLSEIEKANEVVYTSTVDGAVYRKSDDRRLIEMAKRADDAELARRKADIEKRDAEFAKKGDEVLKHFPKGTKNNLRPRVIKAINAEFTDPAEYEEAIAALRGHDEAVKMLGRPMGASGAGEGPESSSVQKRLDAKIDEYAKAHKLPRELAVARATASDPEIRALYNEAQLAGN